MDTRDYPSQFPPTIVQVIDNITFSKGKSIQVVGSAGLRAMQYPSDIDVFEEATIISPTIKGTIKKAVSNLKSIVKFALSRPYTYISDLKCGIVPSWIILTETPSFSVEHARKKALQLYNDSILTSEELNETNQLLSNVKDDIQDAHYWEAIAKLRFHVLRWSPQNILHGTLKTRGYTFFLDDCLRSPAPIKMDLILLEDGRFIELSVMYKLKFKNGTFLNPFSIDIVSSFKRDIVKNVAKGNYYKAAKRLFSLSRIEHKIDIVNRLLPLFNGDLGRLNQVIADLQTLELLMESATSLPKARVKEELANMPYRLSHIYGLKDFLMHEKRFDKTLKLLETNTTVKALEDLTEALNVILQAHTQTLMAPFT